MSSSLSRSTLFCCRPSGHAFERMTRTCWTRPPRFRLSPSDLTGTLGTTDTVGTCPRLNHITGPDFVGRRSILTSNYNNRSYFHLFCSAWEFPFGMLRHRGSLDNSHKDIYSFTAPCANPRLFLHWSSSPTAHIRLCDQAEVHCDRGVSREIRQIKVHPGVGWRNLSREEPIPR